MNLRYFFVALMYALLPATYASAHEKDSHPTLPLTPVDGDSIVVDDFFWNGELRRSEPLFPGLKPTPWSVSKKDLKRAKKLSAKWSEACRDLDLTGCRKSEKATGALQSAINVMKENAMLALATGEAKYADIVERAYYNGICHYQLSDDKDEALAAAQAIRDMTGYMMATSGEHLYINMYVRSDARIKTDDLDFSLMTTTSTPWYYQVMFQFLFAKKEQHVVLHLRIPDWLGNIGLPSYQFQPSKSRYTVGINGKSIVPKVENGYIVIDQVLCDTSYIHLTMPTPIRRATDPERPGQVAIQKGPLLYTFLNFPDGKSLRGSDAIHSEFDKHRHTNVLSAPVYDAAGQKAGTWQAEPYPYNRKRNDARLYARALDTSR